MGAATAKVMTLQEEAARAANEAAGAVGGDAGERVALVVERGLLEVALAVNQLVLVIGHWADAESRTVRN